VAKIALVVQIWLISRIDDDSISNQFLQWINLSLSLSRSLALSLTRALSLSFVVVQFMLKDEGY